MQADDSGGSWWCVMQANDSGGIIFPSGCRVGWDLLECLVK